MSYFINGESGNELWVQAKDLIDLQGESFLNTKELLHVLLTLHNPVQKWVSCREPCISIGFALAELVWIVKGENRADIINFWNPKYKKYAEDKGLDYYHGAYGFRLRKNFEFDQLNRAYESLSSNPNSRQAVILYWDPIKDFPNSNGSSQSNDIPCNVCSLLKIRNGKLDWTQIMRSNDLVKGLPYNLVQFTGLQEILAGWLGVDVGKYVHYSDSLHIYDYDNKTQYTNNINVINNDSLSIPKESSHKIIDRIYEGMCKVIGSLNPIEEIKEYAELNSGFCAYDNINYIILAYAANKLKNYSLAEELISRTTNELYKQMWKGYLQKKHQ